jgi:hypothetical protein
MATAAAGANVALRFDIVADATSFKSAVSEARDGWRTATVDMREQSGGVGEGFLSALGKMTENVTSFATEVQSALSGGASGVESATLKGFEAIKGGAASTLDYLGSFGEKWGGQFGKVVGETVASAAKTGIDPVFNWFTTQLGSVAKSDMFASVTAGVAQLAAGVDSLTGNYLGLTDRVQSFSQAAQEGIANAVAVAQGARLAAADFEAILAPLDKQILQHERAAELVGKTVGEVAQLRAEWAMLDAEVNSEGMAEDQTAKIAEKMAALRESAQRTEDLETARSQAKVFEGIVQSLDRQLQITRLKGGEHRKTVGEISEERAIIEATTRMKQRGRELSDEELASVRQRAAAQGQVLDLITRENAERQAIKGFDRQAENIRTEIATMGMATGAAAAYKAEMAAVQRFKEANVPLSEEFRARIQAEAAAIGEATAAAAQFRSGMQFVRDVGATAMRSLESVFDSFVEGRKVSWKSMIDSFVADLAKLSFRAALAPIFGGGGGAGGGMMASLFASMFGGGGGVGSWTTTSIPARAGGGPVTAGMPYKVGERGEELFVPNTSGTIVPNHAMGGGGVQVNIVNNHPGARLTTRETDDGRGQRQTQVVIEEMVATGLAGPGGQAAMRGFGARPNLTSR